MSTYEEFMVILTIAMLIVAILSLKNKKQPFLSLAKVGTATLVAQQYFAGTGGVHLLVGCLVKFIIADDSILSTLKKKNN